MKNLFTYIMLLIPSVLVAQHDHGHPHHHGHDHGHEHGHHYDPVDPLACGPQTSEVDEEFENWLQIRRSGNRNSDYFVKYIPIAFHSYDGAIAAEDAEAAFTLLQEQMLGTGIVPCRAEGNFYNEWDNLPSEDPIYDNTLYFQAMQATELAGTSAMDVCNIHVFESLGAGIAGFSWINQNPATRPWDGIYLKSDFATTATITHEMGHYCGLFHTFNGGQCNGVEADCETEGDRVCDTPPTLVNYSCDNPNCEEADYTNHMDYTPNSCRDHFTIGQILRMHAILNNGYRASVWQSGECTDPNFLDIQLLSVRNERRCDDVFVPVIKVANFSAIDADDAVLSVVLNGQTFETTLDVPAMSIQSVEGTEMSVPYDGDYIGEAFVSVLNDVNPDNNVSTFQYSPRPLATFNVVIQHDAWPESEQWKLYKEGQSSPFYTGQQWYAAAGYNTNLPYDTYEDGFSWEPYFTHDEVCLSEGCYGGWFRHHGYASTQELYDNNPDYEGLVCGVDIYVERGFQVDTLYSYHITAFSDSCGLNILCEEENQEFMIGEIGGPSYNWVYDLCVEDRYDELLDVEESVEDCMGDFNNDGERQLDDLLMICGELGTSGAACVCDTDGDMVVDIVDFANFLQVYGLDCEGNELAPPTVRQLEELNLNPTYFTMEGKLVPAGPVARGAYIAQFEINGVRNTVKVIL